MYIGLQNLLTAEHVSYVDETHNFQQMYICGGRVSFELLKNRPGINKLFQQSLHLHCRGDG